VIETGIGINCRSEKTQKKKIQHGIRAWLAVSKTQNLQSWFTEIFTVSGQQ
jgi:hypothetical protein